MPNAKEKFKQGHSFLVSFGSHIIFQQINYLMYACLNKKTLGSPKYLGFYISFCNLKALQQICGAGHDGRVVLSVDYFNISYLIYKVQFQSIIWLN